MKELESLLLRISAPAGNRQSGGFARSENLARRFSRDVRTHYQHQLDALFGRTRPRGRIRSGSRSRAERDRPDLAGWFQSATTIRATFKGTRYLARVQANGLIRLNGKLFKNPSHAARAVCKRGVNGWSFWHVKNEAGEWVRLRSLAKR